MKLLIVSPKFDPVIGGGETFVLNPALLLYKAGIDVSVAAEPNAQREMKNYPFTVYEINGLSDTHLDVISASEGLSELTKQLKPDLIHVHGYLALLAIGLCGINQRVPILASIHSTPVWGERLIGMMDSFEEELSFARNVIDLARPQIITAANEVYAEAARKVVQGRVKVITVPYPVDLDSFHRQDNPVLRRKLGLTEKDILILTPSRIIERKGIREIVYALDDLPDNFYLCLPAAFSPLDKRFWDDITASDIYQRVKNRVIIPDKQFLYLDMPLLYAASDIVAMPSYYEGAPVATVEAMASGKPFIGADSQGINSFIRDNENGLLVPQKTVKELAAGIYKLAQDKELCARLSQRALAGIAYLSWDVQLRNLINIYNQLMATGETNVPADLSIPHAKTLVQ